MLRPVLSFTSGPAASHSALWFLGVGIYIVSKRWAAYSLPGHHTLLTREKPVVRCVEEEFAARFFAAVL